MYSPRLYKERDSYVLYIPTVHAFGSLSLTNTLLVQTHKHNVSAPWFLPVYFFRVTIWQSVKKQLFLTFFILKIFLSMSNCDPEKI